MKFVLFMGLLMIAQAQFCLNHEGRKVDWWVALKVPPKIGSTGFGYYDSTYTGSQFSYVGVHIDQGSTALTQTLLQVEALNMESVAWNDEKPTGQTSTTSAHSKGLIAYSPSSRIGFLFSHSFPKYPAYVGPRINITIAPPQNYYGQHAFCLSLQLKHLNTMASHLMMTHLYAYYSSVKNTSETNNLYQIGQGRYETPSQLFQYQEISLSSKLKSIYKNGGGSSKNCSIFEDGLVNYLKSNLIVESWGRPLDPSWCAPKHEVLNVKEVHVGNLSWSQQDDHAKWAYAPGYACFGDMNRMSSQWKRGGSFFCLQHKNLSEALKKVISKQDQCSARGYLRLIS